MRSGASRLVLPNTGVTENGRERCNEPLIVGGKVVAYCERLVKMQTSRRPRGRHRGQHRVEWWGPGQ